MANNSVSNCFQCRVSTGRIGNQESLRRVSRVTKQFAPDAGGDSGWSNSADMAGESVLALTNSQCAAGSGRTLSQWKRK